MATKKELTLEELFKKCEDFIGAIYRLEATAKELKLYPTKMKIEWVVTSEKFPQATSRSETLLGAMEGFFSSLKKARKI